MLATLYRISGVQYDLSSLVHAVRGVKGGWSAGRVECREGGVQGVWSAGRVECRECGVQGVWSAGSVE